MRFAKLNISRIIIIAIVLLVFISFVGGCRKAGTWLVREDLPEKADALVMLMGSIPDRVLQTADFYNEGRANKVLLVEESMGPAGPLTATGFKLVTSTEQVINALVYLGVPRENIFLLPGEAKSTQMEAEAVRDYLKSTQTGIESLILVSSSHHMRRGTMIFEAALKPLQASIEVYSGPSFYTEFNAGHWWREREDIQDVVLEYLKIFNFKLFEKRKLKPKHWEDEIERGVPSGTPLHK